ncbi:MAG: hypothetical protein R3211_05785 [Balneolaceae bacterium]|nr:hypothetical protein [Balneolaceae bacterium]
MDIDKTVPFQIPNVSHGLQTASGLLKLGEDGLALEFEVKDSLVGVLKSGVREVDIPYSKLESIEFEKGWFSGKIILEGTSMRVFEDLPGVDVATCTLKVKHGDRREAEKLISRARLALSEHRLNEMGDAD